ncbi:MAG TPA: phosphopeptide-binding protein, partial [Cyanobacteria bacterium UBA11368]|nr:phosphopeptide-binding protein [Cyanobacteria bacterium UBA11368]
MPVPQEHNHLLIVEDDKGRKEVVLKAPVYSIGRDPQCDIRLV